jgi:hypothetical protein
VAETLDTSCSQAAFGNNISTEIKDGQKIKSEIAHDFTRLSKQVEAAVNER